jgi:dTDP-4-amino-4,6-dideoxygalactose transaminase
MIPIVKPLFDACEKDALMQSIDQQWVGQGPQVAAFERALERQQAGVSAVAVNSGTAALHLLLQALEVGDGDTVILPAFSFVATANVLEYCHAKPIFVDIDAATFNLDVDLLKKLLQQGSQAKALMVVHEFGLMMDVAALRQLLGQHSMSKTRIIEDAACASGASFTGDRPGKYSDGACFSMHPRKLITAGEGGYVVTGDSKLTSRIKLLRNHGLDENGDMHELGYNYRMTDLQGGLALAQLSKLDDFVRARCQQAEVYTANLAAHSVLQLPIANSQAKTNWQSYVVRLKPSWLDAGSEASILKLKSKRDVIIAFAQQNGVQLRTAAQAFAELSYYQKKYGMRPMDYPVSFLAASATLALPIYPGLSADDQQVVIDVVEKALTILED